MLPKQKDQNVNPDRRLNVKLALIYILLVLLFVSLLLLL